MFQKFYTDTLGGRFIKSLLAQTPIPIFESAVSGDYIIEDCYYIYKNRIIKCVKTGTLTDIKEDTLFPGNTIYPEIDPKKILFPKLSLTSAQFKVIDYANKVTPLTHHTFESSTNYYDSETHFYLGKYLRYLYTTTGLNLFPYYNCYNSTYFSDVEIRPDKVLRTTEQKYKVVGIPILIGHTYTIAIDCSTKVSLRAIMHDSTHFIDEKILPSSVSSLLAASYTDYLYLSFNKPITFRLDTTEKDAYLLQKNLYLVIQLPKDNDSSIVVLENYTASKSNSVTCDEHYVRTALVNTNPSLLYLNTKQSYAFSDRLIEYLLGNVITKDDVHTNNIKMVQNLFCETSHSYKESFNNKTNIFGIWDNNISQLTTNYIEKYDGELFDQDGNINKDVLPVIKAAAVAAQSAKEK